MDTFLIVFGILAALTVYAIRTSRQIDRMADAEWAEIESDRLKREMCRDAIIGNVCSFKCDQCAWHVEEETNDD